MSIVAFTFGTFGEVLSLIDLTLKVRTVLSDSTGSSEDDQALAELEWFSKFLNFELRAKRDDKEPLHVDALCALGPSQSLSAYRIYLGLVAILAPSLPRILKQDLHSHGGHEGPATPFALCLLPSSLSCSLSSDEPCPS